MSASNPTASIVVREHRGQPFYEAKFRYGGRQIKRRIGPAWLERDPDATVGAGIAGASPRAPTTNAPPTWPPRSSWPSTSPRPQTSSAPSVSAARRARPSARSPTPTCDGWRTCAARSRPRWSVIARCSPSRAPRTSAAAESRSGTSWPRSAIDRPRRSRTREIEAVLTTISETGASPRTVNKHRNVIAAVFGYGCKPSTYALPVNPAKGADKRREPHPGALVFYSPEEIEAIARALADGRHRDRSTLSVSDQEREALQRRGSAGRRDCPGRSLCGIEAGRAVGSALA